MQEEACVRMEKIASSRVFVPLISWDTLNRILDPTGSLDYVLLEWVFALEMKAHDQVPQSYSQRIAMTRCVRWI